MLKFKNVAFFILLIIFCLYISYEYYSKEYISITLLNYPDGKDFSFTITEDPDYSKIEDREIVYEFLDQLKLKTTISIWVISNKYGSGVDGGLTNTRGMTTENINYLRHLEKLQEKGFEICLHTVGPGNDLRSDTIYGYEVFKNQFGHYPKININHATNIENIYWGSDRFSNFFLRQLYSLFIMKFEGHLEESKYFWGDLCREKTKYVRGWATDELNTLSVNKTMPYHLNNKPYVNWWFGCSDGYNLEKMNKLLKDENIETLIAERGTSIIYTHFAYGCTAVVRCSQCQLLA